MKKDTKQDYEELKRQERNFMRGLIGSVLITCAGGLLYLVNQAPTLAKKDFPVRPNEHIIKQLAEEANQEKAKTALAELVKIAEECHSTDTEILKILGEIRKNPAEGKLDRALLSRLRELEKQRQLKASQLDDLSFAGLSPDETDKLEVDRKQAREHNEKAEAFIKRLKSQLAIDNQ